jgi:Lon protease-like protein
MSETSEIPLFPLSAVLLPHGRMPLQIFEQRYLDLVRQCMRDGSGFGVIWLRSGGEVAGSGEPQLGDYGTYARIVDWDQLPNGLLGITIRGGERFRLHGRRRLANQLLMGEVSLEGQPQPEPLREDWAGFARLLRGLESHPHVQRIGVDVDYEDARQVAGALMQLLPLEEALKYRLLGLDDIDTIMDELDQLLNEVSGAD